MKTQSTRAVLSYFVAVFVVGLLIGGSTGYTLARQTPARLPPAQKFEDEWLEVYRSDLSLTDEQVRAIKPLLRKPVEDLSGIWYRAIMTMGAVQESVDRKVEPLLNDQQREKLVALIQKSREKRRHVARERFSQKAGKPDHIWYAAAVGDLETIRRHLQAGVDINKRDLAFGMTPLAIAAAHGQTGSVELLLQEGADVDAAFPDGNTALHVAAFFGRTKVVRVLLDHGAQALARNEEGKTPLDGMAADWETIHFISAILQVELDQATVETGRREVAELLRAVREERPHVPIPPNPSQR